jgi:hypothetical protein
MLRPGDLLAVSANLAPAAPGTAAFGSGAESVPEGKAWAAAYEEACLRVLPQYDNPETHRWLRQVLVEWGLDPLLDGTRFGLEWIGEVLGLCARCAWKIRGPLDWEGTVLAIEASRALRLFFSLRYTPAIVTRKLHAHGFRVEHGFQTPCSQEGVWVATRRA